MKIPSCLSLIECLVAIPSISSADPKWDRSNLAIIEQLAQWLEALGFQIEITPVANSNQKYNLIARAGKGENGLVLAGHSDTVPFDDAQWNSDPFVLTQRNQRLYGLGSADMKSFFALLIEAIRELDLNSLQQPLTIVATADEETTMNGAKQLQKSGGHLGRYALIGEPTGLRPIRMHKGMATEIIRLQGKSGHSSNPALGANALEGMQEVIAEIQAWCEELKKHHRNPLFAVAYPTVNMGRIFGGDSPNRICSQCELHIDMRPLPGMEIQPLRQQLHDRLQKRLQDSPLTLTTEPIFDGIPAMETDASSAIVQVTESLTRQTAGAVDFGTEAPFFKSLGLETVILGAGNIEQAHQPNEYLERSMITPMVDLIRSLIKRFCLTPDYSP